MKQHLGTILEKAVRQSGYPITKVAKSIGYTRQHMYNLFLQAQIDLTLLEKIGKVINHNFADDVKQLKKYQYAQEELYTNVKENSIAYEKEDFKGKYYKLLEEYNQLLKDHAKLLKSMTKK